jgi:hypothetical protein
VVKAKQGFRGYPVATIAFYGPTADLATKLVVSIVRDEGQDPDPLERWISEDTDVRNDPAIGEKVLAFLNLKENGAKSVVVTDGLIGCPHEEGIDYPRGNPAHIAPTGQGATASRASASTETAALCLRFEENRNSFRVRYLFSEADREFKSNGSQIVQLGEPNFSATYGQSKDSLFPALVNSSPKKSTLLKVLMWI